MPNRKQAGKPAPAKPPPFIAMTGNPENGDYLDWYKHLINTGQLDPSTHCTSRKKS